MKTLACGTGATASAIAAFESGMIDCESVKVNVFRRAIGSEVLKKNNYRIPRYIS